MCWRQLKRFEQRPPSAQSRISPDNWSWVIELTNSEPLAKPLGDAAAPLAVLGPLRGLRSVTDGLLAARRPAGTTELHVSGPDDGPMVALVQREAWPTTRPCALRGAVRLRTPGPCPLVPARCTSGCASTRRGLRRPVRDFAARTRRDPSPAVALV